MSKYLFISCHTDDAELSCGGTMAKLVEEGHKVNNLAFSSCGSMVLSDEFFEASKVLGVLGECAFYNKIYDADKIGDDLYTISSLFDTVFTHSSECRHTHHKIIGEQSKRIFNCNLLTYIQPWNGQDAENYFVEISERQLQKKIEALACYKSQAYRSYMNPEFIEAQARYNGIKCGKLYAEAFKIERLVH